MKNSIFRILTLFLIMAILSCENKEKPPRPVEINEIEIEKPLIKYGFDFNEFSAKELKIKRGDTFGDILENNGIDYPQVYQILKKIKTSINIRKLQIGKPYTLLFTNDSINTPKYFIYHPGPLSYTVIQLRDSIYGK